MIDAVSWRERLGFDGGEQTTNSQIIAETYAGAGAYLMGRRMADSGEIPWGDTPPAPSSRPERLPRAAAKTSRSLVEAHCFGR